MMYATGRWPSIPPGKLVRALLLKALYSIRSDRLLTEQLDYNLLFRWFVGLAIDEDLWNLSRFSNDCELLLGADILWKFFRRIHKEAGEEGLLSDEHFTVDETLFESLATRTQHMPKE